MPLSVRSATDLGLKRSQNEDSHTVWIPNDPAEHQRRGVLLLVADGMGGSLAGEVASRLAVETVLSSYQAGSADVLHDLRESVAAANRAVHTQSRSAPDLAGMGTTCTAMIVRDHEAWLAHVGDSRAYLLRAGRLHQLTQDHSLVAQLVQRQQLTAEEAKVDPRRNVVTRSVGVAAEVDVDAFKVDTALETGDTLLLCSDGLHGQVEPDDLAEAMATRDLDEGCRKLIDLANAHGGPDNITAILARVEPAPEAPPEPVEREQAFASDDVASMHLEPGTGARSRIRVYQLLILALVLLGAAVAVTLLLTRQMVEESRRLGRAEQAEQVAAWR